MVQFTPWALVLAAIAAVLVGLAAYGWRIPSRPGRRPFAVTLATMAVYALGYACQLTATTLAWKLFWIKVQYVGMLALPVALLVFAFDYTGRDRWLHPGFVAAVAAVPAAFVVLSATRLGSGYLVADPQLVTRGGITVIEYSFGTLYPIQIGYDLLLYVVVLLVFLDLAGSDNPIYRRQGRVLLVALLVPLLLGPLNVIFPDETWLDLTPFALLVAGTVISWGIYRSSLLDVVPVNRDLVFTGMEDAVAAVDAEDRVVDANRQTADVFQTDAVVGRDVEALFAEAGFEVGSADLADGDEVTRAGDTPRFYEVGREPIESRLGDVRGYLLFLHDFTHRRELEQQLTEQNEQLSVLNRLLRHDIRNDVAVATGWAELLTDELEDEELASMAETILSANQHIEELTLTSRDLATSLSADESMTLEPVAVGSVLESVVEKAQASYPDAEIHPPSSYPAVQVRANSLLSSVFTNLVNNAVQHNDRDEPTVDVAVTVSDVVHVTIADDGPGVPDGKKDEIFGRGEQGIESSGSGLGLYLVDRLLEEFDGSVEVADNEPRGTVFEIELPILAEDDGCESATRVTDCIDDPEPASREGNANPDDSGDSTAADRE